MFHKYCTSYSPQKIILCSKVSINCAARAETSLHSLPMAFSSSFPPYARPLNPSLQKRHLRSDRCASPPYSGPGFQYCKSLSDTSPGEMTCLSRLWPLHRIYCAAARTWPSCVPVSLPGSFSWASRISQMAHVGLVPNTPWPCKWAANAWKLTYLLGSSGSGPAAKS